MPAGSEFLFIYVLFIFFFFYFVPQFKLHLVLRGKKRRKKLKIHMIKILYRKLLGCILLRSCISHRCSSIKLIQFFILKLFINIYLRRHAVAVLSRRKARKKRGKLSPFILYSTAKAQSRCITLNEHQPN